MKKMYMYESEEEVVGKTRDKGQERSTNQTPRQTGLGREDTAGRSRRQQWGRKGSERIAVSGSLDSFCQEHARSLVRLQHVVSWNGPSFSPAVQVCFARSGSVEPFLDDQR